MRRQPFGLDDTGAAPGNPVRVTVEAGSDLVLPADELESGTGLDAALRDGVGKWRLAVSSDQPLRMMSLMESPKRLDALIRTAATRCSVDALVGPLLKAPARATDQNCLHLRITSGRQEVSLIILPLEPAQFSASFDAVRYLVSCDVARAPFVQKRTQWQCMSFAQLILCTQIKHHPGPFVCRQWLWHGYSVRLVPLFARLSPHESVAKPSGIRQLCQANRCRSTACSTVGNKEHFPSSSEHERSAGFQLEVGLKSRILGTIGGWP